MATIQKPLYNADGTHVFVAAPETGDEWECPVGYLPVALARGFELTEPRDKSLDDLFDDATADGGNQTGFDPGQHTVEEVNAHLAEHAEASPGEVVRVLALEESGKNRASVKDPRIPTDLPDGQPGGAPNPDPGE
jgi:hypothetical protein